MSNIPFNKPIRWTEAELQEDIKSLEQTLASRDDNGTPNATCARAYLKQVLKDRKATLKMLRLRKRAEEGKPVVEKKSINWPAPPPRREFRPLLRV